jgi:gamma-glutamylcysteine synthetase
MKTIDSNIIQICNTWYVKINRKQAIRKGYKVKDLVDVEIKKVKP